MTASDPLARTLLKLFAEARDHKLSAASLTSKLKSLDKKSGITHDPAELDQTLTALIDDGKITVTGASKTAGQHPRAKGSYRLTSAGKDHVKPGKPDASNETLAYQESYLLLQMIRFDERTASRSKLNEKLKSATARQKLDFPADNPKETIDYHLHNLVQAGSLDEKRQGVSMIYTLTDAGLRALGAADQHPTVEFRFPGSALNFLLGVARDSGGPRRADAEPEDETESPPMAHQAPIQSLASVETRQIHDFIAQLKADKYAGRDLIPIHEVRKLVAQHHGDHAATHPVFDPLLKRMRADGEIEIIAIADTRDTPQEFLDDSIPGMNETLFFIDTV